MPTNKRNQGKLGEDIAGRWYTEHGYTICSTNYTIRGGELDIVVENTEVRVAVEVKMVDGMTDLIDYVGAAKMAHLKRTFAWYNRQFPTQKDIRMDLVLVQGLQVREVFENISW